MKPRYTDEQLLELGREEARRLGSEFTVSAFCRRQGVSAATIYRRFGSCDAFRERVGAWRRSAQPLPSRRYTRQVIIDLLRRAVEELGPDLSMSDFVRHSRVSTHTIYRHFESWRALRDCADLEQLARAKKRYPDDVLLEDIDRTAKLLRRAPSRKDYREFGRISLTTFDRRFGSGWESIVERYQAWAERRKAYPWGLNIQRSSRPRSEEEIADEVERQMRADDAEWLRRRAEEEVEKSEGGRVKSEGGAEGVGE